MDKLKEIAQQAIYQNSFLAKNCLSLSGHNFWLFLNMTPKIMSYTSLVYTKEIYKHSLPSFGNWRRSLHHKLFNSTVTKNMSCTALIYTKHVCKQSLQSTDNWRTSLRHKLPTIWDKKCLSSRGHNSGLPVTKNMSCTSLIYTKHIMQTFLTIHWKLEEFAPQSTYYLTGQTDRPNARPTQLTGPVYPLNFVCRGIIWLIRDHFWTLQSTSYILWCPISEDSDQFASCLFLWKIQAEENVSPPMWSKQSSNLELFFIRHIWCSVIKAFLAVCGTCWRHRLFRAIAHHTCYKTWFHMTKLHSIKETAQCKGIIDYYNTEFNHYLGITSN